MSTPYLEIVGIRKDFIRRWTRTSFARSFINMSFKNVVSEALREVSFSVMPGEVIRLEGSNGSGKTTLLKILADRLAPTAGKVKRSGSIVPILVPGVCMHRLLTLKENVYHSYVMLSGVRPENRVVEEILDLALLTDKSEALFHTLSYGMCARLTLAVGLSAPADVYLIDELFDSLDKEIRKRLLARIQFNVSRGSSVIATSHDRDVQEGLGGRAVILGQL